MRFALFGVAGVVLFVLTVVLGGMLTANFSHVRNAVSELTQARSPHNLLLGALFVCSAALFGAFGLSLSAFGNGNGNRGFQACGKLVVLYAVQAALLASVFPQDPIGEPITLNGFLHLFVVGTSALCIVAAMIVAGCSAPPEWGRFRDYSFASVIVMLSSGASTVLLISYDLHFLGLIERITQGAYLQWFVVFSVKLDRSRPGHSSPAAFKTRKS